MEFVEIFDATRDHADFCPLDEWFSADSGLSVIEQYAAGWGLHAASRPVPSTANPRRPGAFCSATRRASA